MEGDIKQVKPEALVLIAKATEMFVEYMAEDAFAYAMGAAKKRGGGPGTEQPTTYVDLANAVSADPRLTFLAGATDSTRIWAYHASHRLSGGCLLSPPVVCLTDACLCLSPVLCFVRYRATQAEDHRQEQGKEREACWRRRSRAVIAAANAVGGDASQAGPAATAGANDDGTIAQMTSMTVNGRWPVHF